MPRTLLASLAAVALTACAAAAQQGNSPPDVRIDRVRMGTDSLQIYLVRRADTIHVGMLWDSLRIIQHAGIPAVHREYRTENRAFGPEHSVYLYTLPNLGPISIADEGTSPEALEFRADSVVGWVTRRGRRREVARALGPGVYDGSVFDLMVRAGDLREGYDISIPAYITETDDVATLTARVTGSERVEVEGGRKVDTWVVKMDFAGISSTLWIDKETRSLARQVILLGFGTSMLMDRLPVRDAAVRDEAERES